MADNAGWNWEPGDQTIASPGEWAGKFEWVEELYASPDGEKIAAVVKTGDGEFNVCVNGELWGDPVEKIWGLRYSPDGRLAGLAQADMVWTVAVDGEPWEESFDYCWGIRFSNDGSTIAAAVQSEGQYGMIVNGETWPTLYENANHFSIEPAGRHTAAVVQVKSLAQADIITFQEGIFSLAVDGNAWDGAFVNIWNLSFSKDGSSVAAESRLNLYDYTILVDGKPWNDIFQCVWTPKFNPASGAVVAPGRRKGKWTLYENGKQLWGRNFVQCWHHEFSADGGTLAAIVATKLGKWTVAVNGTPWNCSVAGIASDLTVTDDGAHVAALGKDEDGKWYVMHDGRIWGHGAEMAYKPVFSPDGSACAVRIESGGRFNYLINGVMFGRDADMLFDPIFSADGKMLLVRSVEGGKFIRRVVPVNSIVG